MQPEIKLRLEHLLRDGPQKIHLIGVCGSGMSGLGRLLLAQGHHVSGSDLVAAADATDYVPAGVRYFEGHAASNIEGVALVVFSSAIAAENPERIAALEQGVLTVRRAECLGNGHSQFPDQLSANPSAASHIQCECLTIEIFHYDEFPAVVHVDIVNRANIRMI